MAEPSVLHLAQPVDGGVARCVVDIARDQAARGWTVTVGCPDGGILAPSLGPGVRRERWDAARAGRSATPSQLRHLRELVARVRPDVVHLHSASAGMTGRLVLRGRTPTLFQPHGWSWQAVSGNYARAVVRWERLAARWSRSLVCVSEAERAAGERHGLRGRFVVVPNGVDLTAFPATDARVQAETRAALGLPGTPTALCVGRFDEQKGHETALRAWPQVRAAVPGARLLLVGSGSREQRLREVTAELGLDDAVTFAGERADVPRWYAAADLLVFPSLWGEGMALTPLEAMSSGRPVIASDVAGVREVLGADRGAVVPAGDAAALGAAVAALLGDPAALWSAGRAARAYAESSLDVRRSHDRLAALVVEAAGS